MLQVYSWVSAKFKLYYRQKGWAGVSQMFQMCPASCCSLFDHQRETCTSKLLDIKHWLVSWRKISHYIIMWNSSCEINMFLFCSFSVLARHMTQRLRPPKTSQMRWSVSFDSTLLCIALSTLWLANRCSHVSEWTTPSLRSWWTEFWQRMDNMKSCSWEQVRHTFLQAVSWNAIFD